MLFIVFSLRTFVVGFVTCQEKDYESLILEPTNPFYKEQFQMNQQDFTTYTDALGFGFWSQYRPYQDIQDGNQVDYQFQPSYQLNGNLLFSIRNTDTNEFETVYFLYSPLFSTYIFHSVAQLQQSQSIIFDQKYFPSYTLRYEGMWVYTHFQFVPLQELIYVRFLSYGQLITYTFLFQLNQYGNKEIIIGGSGRIFNYFNLGIFNGRISRPVQLQLQKFFINDNEFWTYYLSCNVPKSCSVPTKIDIIKDQLYMDSTMYYTQTVRLQENAYTFGGWVKVDISNISTNTYVLLIRATINKAYKNNQLLGDKSFSFEYFMDLFENMSAILVEQYSYIIPQKGYITNNGKTYKEIFVDSESTVQNNMQEWHFVKFSSGIYQQNQRIATAEIFFPIIKKQLQYQFFQYDINENQFTSDYLYLHIGVDKYQISSQFKGWIQDFQIWTCLDVSSTSVQVSCHFTCQPTTWCLPDKKCEQCPINSHRQFFQLTKLCECQEGYYTIENQPGCEKFMDHFQFFEFSVTLLIYLEECQLGYYQYQSQCYQCPFNIQDDYFSCLECIQNKRTWYVNPICETDYIKLIGNVDEPFFSRKRPINEVDLFKINSLNYLELCQGCYEYCDSLSSVCFLSNHYHLGTQMIVKCKQNYYFDQILLKCNKCINNCEICDNFGQCVQCIQQHYFDPNLRFCLQCDIRCAECQYNLQLNQQVCISCPIYFTLYNGICLKCGVYCKSCQAAFYKSTGQVYARCNQCIDHQKQFISFDAINCHLNMIFGCLYEFQYYQNPLEYNQSDRQIQTIDMMFEPRALDSTIKSGCAKCGPGQIYIISEFICLFFNQNIEYLIVENRVSTIIALSADYSQAQSYTTIQVTGGCTATQNCYACVNSKTDQMAKCTMCNTGFYMQKLRGNCIKCPVELNCQVCEQQQKINKDYFKLQFKAFYEYFINFDGQHNYEDYAQSQNVEDFEIVCTVCHFGYQPIDGRCVKDCPENCAECAYNNGQLQCLKCYDTIQGIMQTLVNNQCIQCPFNCGVCLPQDSIQVYQYNPYFSNKVYSYFTNVCLSLIKQLPIANYYYDPEIGNYIQCIELQQCKQEVHFQMIVHCNDQQYEQLLLSSSNAIQFRQQNIKLSQLFSTTIDPHIPEYQNDIVYLRFNQKSIKKINQTFIFTNSSECVISEGSSLINQFSHNVYSIKETHINLIGIVNNVKIYFTNQLYIDGFTNVLFQNIELISTELYPINFIIVSHLINVKIILETIKFSTLSQYSTISFSAINSSDLTINGCYASNLNYIQTHFITIQNPLWQIQGLYNNNIMNVVIHNFSLINCTFTNSSIIHNILDNQYVFSFKNIVIKAEFINSFISTQFESLKFSNKIILLESITIESKIYNSDGFFNFQQIDAITISQLTFTNSIISNSIFIKGNSNFEFINLYFLNIQMLGHSILLQYEASISENAKNIEISTLNFVNVSYEQINSFIYFVDSSANNQLKLTYLSLEGNYLAKHLQNSNLEIFYYSALIYIEMVNVNIMNSNILRMSGFYEFALVNTQNITLGNITINQKDSIKGLHQYLDCQQKQNYSNLYFSVLQIYRAKYTFLSNIKAQKLVLYNYPLIQYQSIDISQNIQSEIVIIKNSMFSSNIILITQDIKSSSIIMIKSEQLIEIIMNEITFTQNQINLYLISKYKNSCLINLQCLNGTVSFNQLSAIDNLVTNDTQSVFYLNMKSIKLTNSYFHRNNIFDYEKIKGNLMWSFPSNISSITIESLQNIFPIKSDGLFMIIFEVLFIDNITINQAQGCKGGAFQLYSLQNGIVNISNSIFSNIKPSLNCDQSFGGVLYLDSTKSKLIATITQISIDKVMSLNLGGFLYILSATNELNIIISHIEATNYQSLQGSFLYASLQQSKGLAQEINIYNCSLTNQFPDFINYLGYLSTFQNLDTSNLLKDRVLFFFVNGQISMKQIVIHELNYESFILVSGCITMDFQLIIFWRRKLHQQAIIQYRIQFNSQLNDQSL